MYYQYNNDSSGSDRSYRLGGMGLTPVVKWLLIANVAVFLLRIFPKLGVSLIGFGAIQPVPEFMPWQLVTYMFLHADIWHIFFNMFALWMFGSYLEYNMGSKMFSIYYFTVGVLVGGLLVIMGQSAIGASGAVYALLLAFAYFWPNLPVYVWGVFPLKAKYLVLIFGFIEFISMSTPSNISHLGHLGGIVIGFIFLQIKYRKYWPFSTMG